MKNVYGDGLDKDLPTYQWRTSSPEQSNLFGHRRRFYAQPQPKSECQWSYLLFWYFFPFHTQTVNKEKKTEKRKPPSVDETRRLAFTGTLTPSPILAMFLPNDVGHLFLAAAEKKVCLSYFQCVFSEQTTSALRGRSAIVWLFHF